MKTLEEFKLSVYGKNYEEEEAGKGKVSEAAKKRKAISESAAQKCKEYDWADLADNGKVKTSSSPSWFVLIKIFSLINPKLDGKSLPPPMKISDSTT